MIPASFRILKSEVRDSKSTLRNWHIQRLCETNPTDEALNLGPLEVWAQDEDAYLCHFWFHDFATADSLCWILRVNCKTLVGQLPLM